MHQLGVRKQQKVILLYNILDLSGELYPNQQKTHTSVVYFLTLTHIGNFDVRLNITLSA
jgi:hypothetical protein